MVKCLSVFCSFCFNDFKKLNFRNQGTILHFVWIKAELLMSTSLILLLMQSIDLFFRTFINLEGFMCARPHTHALL